MSHLSDFSTQSYRHGVLVGNWHEDEFGLQLIRSDPVQQAKYESTFHSIHQLSYTVSGLSEARQDLFQQKFRPQAGSVETGQMIFAHGTEQEKKKQGDERWQTTYKQLFTCNYSPINLTSSKVLAEKAKEIERQNLQLRMGSYESESQSAMEKTIQLAKEHKETQKNLHGKSSNLGRKFEGAEAKLKLRT
jgi:hypothetical protein